jgi:hypothetical protein
VSLQTILAAEAHLAEGQFLIVNYYYYYYYAVKVYNLLSDYVYLKGTLNTLFSTDR